MLASQCRAWEASYNNAEAARAEMQASMGKLKERVDELEWELDETRVSLEDSQHQVAKPPGLGFHPATQGASPLERGPGPC